MLLPKRELDLVQRHGSEEVTQDSREGIWFFKAEIHEQSFSPCL